jgi:hypothetical protein|eukprot:4933456-Prymnesium_polylepis.2
MAVAFSADHLLDAGVRVKITGLVARPDLNEQFATVCAPVALREHERLRVCVTTRGEEVSIRHRNVRYAGSEPTCDLICADGQRICAYREEARRCYAVVAPYAT